MLMMFEEGTRGGMCQATYRYAKANNKYMKNYDENKESSFLIYDDANNLYGFAMCKKLPVSDFKWVDDLSIFTEDFIKNYDEEDDTGYLFVVDVEYPKNLHKLHSDLPFLPERMKINNCTKLVCNLNDKENYPVHVLALKQALNHGLKLTKVHSVIEFRQEEWLKPYIDMNTELRKNAKNDFEKDFFKLMNNSVFGKTMENVRNHRDIRVVTIDKRRSILASEPNYHSTKYISKDLLIMVMKRVEVKMNKPIYLGQAILDISKTLMYEFWYDYIEPKYKEKARLCYMDTDSFVMNIKTEDFYKDIARDVERWFDTSNYDEKDKRPLPIGKNKKVIGLFKDELGGKIMTEFCALRAKAYAYKLDDDTEMKKAKGTKKCIVKREITFKNYADALFNDEVIIRSQQRFRSYNHKVYTEEVNKIALSSNDNKRIQTFDKVTTFPYGTNVFKVCENEMLLKNKLIQPDEHIDNTETEDIVISKVEDIDFSKTEDIDISENVYIDISKIEDIDNTKTGDTDISKTEDIDNTKTKDKDEDIDNGRNKLIRMFRYSTLWKGKKGNQEKKILSGSFGITIPYQNYVKSGYTLMVTMHTQVLKSFAHVLVKCFLLESIRPPYQKIKQTHT